MNPEIKKLHKSLIKTHQELSKRLGRTADPDEAEAILREMSEVNFRAMMAGQLLFKQTTIAVNEKIGAVLKASAAVDQSIRDLETIRDVVKGIGKFLTLVDKALDAAKLLI
ncbi:MAG: hypothetical protein R3B57_04785 [Phycisphaerales bacterium]